MNLGPKDIRKVHPLILLSVLCVFYLLQPADVMGHVFLDELGRSVSIPSEPRRIVSMAPNLTEILFYLGLEDRIVGVTQYCNYPSAALKKDRIGGFVNPSVEKIIALKPDLVFATVDGNRKETVAQIEKIGLPVFVVNPVTMEGFFKTISRIGKITGHTRESRDLIAQLRKKQQHIQSLTDPLPKTKVFFQVGVDPIITVGNDTFIDELIGLAGGLNIYGGETQRYPRCSIEDVLMKDPAVIILATMGGKNTFERANQYWRQWKQVQAVRKGRIHWIDPDTIDRFSPRIMDALEALTILLHPDLQGRLKRKGH